MKRLLLFPLLAGAMLLAGCTTQTSSSTPAQITAVEEGVTIAETLALNYTRLPACPTQAPVCADPATKLRVKASGQRAHDAVKTLQVAPVADQPAALVAAVAALSAFQAEIPPPSPAK